ERHLENELVREAFAEDGSIEGLFDKEAEREVLDGPGNRLLLWEDDPHFCPAWDVFHYYRETKPEQALLRESAVEYATPSEACIVQRYAVGSSTITQRVVLRAHSKALEFRTHVAWDEKRKMLRTHFETAVDARRATYEIQFGQLERPTHENTSWDWAAFEVCGHRYADLSEPDYGVALLSDCKYGYRIRDRQLEMNLLRSSQFPDKTADIGEHEFTYVFLPHTGDLAHSDVFTQAHELDHPVIVQPLSDTPDQPVRSFFRIDGANVKIETVKRAEDGSGTVLRLYETMGTRARVTLRADTTWESVDETNLIEEPIERISGPGNELPLQFTPFEIRTFVLG
ncbi:MAG: alpha-mannosidase, partial [Chitinivibrionales bacterium]|nr:alpha-mannosidase [Chitinivibrionales bacterium]